MLKRVIRDFMRLSDKLTYEHHGRTMTYCWHICQNCKGTYNFDDEYCHIVPVYATFHDIGKIAVHDDILHKPGPLTKTERNLVREHPKIGLDLVRKIRNYHGDDYITNFDILENIVVQHHERMDGNGYPFGLRKDEISVEAQIVMVADAFDAMTSVRPYQPIPLTKVQALSELFDEANNGTMNKDFVDALASVEEY